jgi:hypothetical protein
MGDEYTPMSFNHWSYGFSNPINFRDSSGLAPTNVNCSRINQVLTKMRELCEVANGDVEDSTQRYYVLTARKQFFREIQRLSMTASGIFGEGYWWAGALLGDFLDNEVYVDVPLSSNSSFQSDKGILRATNLNLPKQAGDDAEKITPLLHIYLMRIKESGVCSGVIPDIQIDGKDTYVNGFARPRDTGWWGAFGHVTINASYTSSRIHQSGYGYYISTIVNYTIDDDYIWGNKRGTPLPLGPISSPLSWRPDNLRSMVGDVEIPHAWEESLRNYHWANEFKFRVHWSEHLDIIVPETFDAFYTASLYDKLGSQ